MGSNSNIRANCGARSSGLSDIRINEAKDSRKRKKKLRKQTNGKFNTRNIYSAVENKIITIEP
jgi:hypothetical protein